jgi:hypothetical protein
MKKSSIAQRIWRASDLLLPVGPHRFATVAGQGWLAGPQSSQDADKHLPHVRAAFKLRVFDGGDELP